MPMTMSPDPAWQSGWSCSVLEFNFDNVTRGIPLSQSRCPSSKGATKPPATRTSEAAMRVNMVRISSSLPTCQKLRQWHINGLMRDKTCSDIDVLKNHVRDIDFLVHGLLSVLGGNLLLIDEWNGDIKNLLDTEVQEHITSHRCSDKSRNFVRTVSPRQSFVSKHGELVHQRFEKSRLF